MGDERLNKELCQKQKVKACKKKTSSFKKDIVVDTLHHGGEKHISTWFFFLAGTFSVTLS
jgi:hypothetical protein